MSLSEYAKDGEYEYDECGHDDAESLIQTGLLGFCGCGTPQRNLEYILGALKLIQEPFGWDRVSFTAINQKYEDHARRVREHHGNDAAAYFFYYWADKEELTEHGGAVPGWLAPKGEELLGLLLEWAEKEGITDEDDEG